MSVALSDLRTIFRQRSEQVNSQYITDPELNGYINAGAQELYSIIVERYERYSTTGPITFTVATPPDSGDAYTMPSDFFKLVKIERQDTGSPEPWLRCHKAEFQDNNNVWYDGGSISPASGHYYITYDIVGQELYLFPYQYAAGTYRFWYTPFLPLLVADSDTLPGYITGPGWHEYIILDCLIKWAVKQEDGEHAALLTQLKEQVNQRIIAASVNRDEGQAQHVSDNTGRRGGGNRGGNGFGWGGC